MASAGNYPKICEVPNGCGKLLGRTAFYSHKTTEKCKRREDGQEEEDNLQRRYVNYAGCRLMIRQQTFTLS